MTETTDTATTITHVPLECFKAYLRSKGYGDTGIAQVTNLAKKFFPDENAFEIEKAINVIGSKGRSFKAFAAKARMASSCSSGTLPLAE